MDGMHCLPDVTATLREVFRKGTSMRPFIVSATDLQGPRTRRSEPPPKQLPRLPAPLPSVSSAPPRLASSHF